MTEQREGMTELGEGKTELDKLIKAAQAVVDICDRKVIIGVLEPVASNCIEALRQAVEQAKVVEAVGEFVDADGCDCVRWDESKPKLPYGTKLYTTPPSVAALIAEIDGLGTISWGTREQMDGVDYDELKAILAKYRSVK